MGEEGGHSPLVKPPNLSEIPLHAAGHSEEATPTANIRLAPTWNGVGKVEKGQQTGIGNGIGQSAPKAATCIPTGPETSTPELSPSPTTNINPEETGFGPGYEHPFWSLLYQAGYRSW